jgi:hypothetical protein
MTSLPHHSPARANLTGVPWHWRKTPFANIVVFGRIVMCRRPYL